MGHRLNGVTGKGGITGERGFKGGIKGERHGPSVPSGASFVQRQQFGREHLGGALGAALASHFTQQGWITREKTLTCGAGHGRRCDMLESPRPQAVRLNKTSGRSEAESFLVVSE